MNTGERLTCPRCGRRTVKRRDGIFGWRACPASKSCGWTVFTHGQDPRDKPEPKAELKLWDLPIFGWAWREDARDLRA
jgi:ribosomal protein L37AE/L43A